MLWDEVRTIMLINTKKMRKYLQEIIIHWCWFVMFASESSQASSFKNSWICAPQKQQPMKKCTSRIHALGSDDATS